MRSFILLAIFGLFFHHSIQAKISFESEVLPILKKNCFQCHEEGRNDRRKPKAGLRLDAAWAILAGSDEGAVIEGGDAKSSELYRRISLPNDDRDLMPPKSRRERKKDKPSRLSAKEIKLVKLWINEGAEFGDWEGNLKGMPKIEETEAATENASGGEPGKPVNNRATTYTSPLEDNYERLAESLPAIEEKAWGSVTEAGARVERLTRDSPLLSVDFRLTATETTDQEIATLSEIAEHIAHLDLSRTNLTDEGLNLLSKMPNLVRLNLSETAAGDNAASLLEKASELRYLNFYSTQLSDEGLRLLEDLPKLESIFLWQSNVTPAGARELEKALQNAKVSFR
ncbi:MAG: c-type cytochrome domain-containing protein [Verrucomicrobiota bacterium]